MNIDHLASLWVSSWFGIELLAQIDVPSFCCHTEERKPVSAASVEHRTVTRGPEKRVFMIYMYSFVSNMNWRCSAILVRAYSHVVSYRKHKFWLNEGEGDQTGIPD